MPSAGAGVLPARASGACLAGLVDDFFGLGGGGGVAVRDRVPSRSGLCCDSGGGRATLAGLLDDFVGFGGGTGVAVRDLVSSGSASLSGSAGGGGSRGCLTTG